MPHTPNIQIQIKIFLFFNYWTENMKIKQVRRSDAHIPLMLQKSLQMFVEKDAISDKLHRPECSADGINNKKFNVNSHVNISKCVLCCVWLNSQNPQKESSQNFKTCWWLVSRYTALLQHSALHCPDTCQHYILHLSPCWPLSSTDVKPPGCVKVVADQFKPQIKHVKK